ncbi:MAG: hypothetical protein L7F78_19710 [Syntrophales bacterium LBB04]|nr:hypothetical protein [Syntrophales bacterium LBB04]
MFTALSAFAAEGSPDGVPRFNINSYHVQGNTLLANATIEAILAPFTGEAKDFGTVQEALDELEGAYHARGFAMVVVTLPEQELENGLIRLNVIESRIQKITMEGMRFFDGENILRSLPALRLGESPNIDNVSRSLKIANENPAKKINLQMLNSDKENEVDAKITVTDERPWKIGISGDNTGTRQTGPTRLGFLFQHANMFNRDHLLTLQYITSPEMLNNVSISSLGYRVPFYALGSSLDLIGAYSNVNSGTVSVGTANMAVSGKGTILGIHYNQNFTRIGNYEHKLTLGLDYRAFENNLDLVGIPLGNNVTVHPVSLTYAGTYNLENQIIAGFYMTALQNLPGS